jgi:hypothetical protein
LIESEYFEKISGFFIMAKVLMEKNLITKSTVFELFLDFIQISNNLDTVLKIIES